MSIEINSLGFEAWNLVNNYSGSRSLQILGTEAAVDPDRLAVEGDAPPP